MFAIAVGVVGVVDLQVVGRIVDVFELIAAIRQFGFPVKIRVDNAASHARTRQHLGGRIPAEAWLGVAKACGDGEFIELWGGALAGWYFPMRE